MNRREQIERAEHLDRMIPLDGASHADAVSYSVDIPMRYAQCFARLADGRTVRLQDCRQFMGWSGRGRDRSLLFRSNGRRIVIDSGAGCNETNGASCFNGVRKFIARDGSLLFIRNWGQELTMSVSERMPKHAMPFREPEGLLNGASI